MYDRSVLRFSFACGLRPHAKLNPRTPLACACLEAAFGRILNWTTLRHRSAKNAAFGWIFKWTTPRHRLSRDAAFGKDFNRTTPRHHASKYAAFGKD